MKNKFCEKSALRNESDVEQFFVARLLKDLGYKDINILTKHAIPAYVIGKGQKRQSHIPDYQVRVGKTPVVIIEAKHPDESIDKYITEAQDYATVVNRGFIGKNPIRYVLATNGIKTKLAKVDENKVLLDLNFEDFANGNEKYKKLQEYISLEASKKSPAITKEEVFEFRTPDLAELKGVFKQAHDLIRRKQKIGPKKAFYEFTKLLFVKMNEDKKIEDKFDAKEAVSIDDFNFSIHKIEKTNESWVNTLFQQYRDDLESLVAKGEKKRIFQKDEKINLSPSTIKAIVEMIESFNLRSVEDDINGKVFETFLEAAVRGKELGQFFTPRSVVKFMVRMAELRITRNKETGDYEPDSVLDGSCGTGGFLIFALSDLFYKIPESHSNKEALKKKIREDSLFGIDASEDDIVPITRMNMYLHGDGGSHIFLADTLDKELLVEKGLERERQDEMKELKTLLEKKKFDVVLTNPPFSMKYEQSTPDEKRILEQYKISSLGGSLVSSLKSNLMFLERYHDLLKPGGKLLTVIDESVLNTEGQGKSMQKFREWLRSKFIVRAVVSLPHNTFVNADAGVKTSVFYLTKRVSEDEEQPPVFMAISKDIGHNDAGRITSEWGDLGNILESFQKFQNGDH
jgi:type I restriction enzyme M protein